MNTIEDVYALPDGKRTELIDGVFYMMSAPTREHQRTVGKAYYATSKHVKEHDGNHEVCFAPLRVYPSDDDGAYLEPNVITICNGGKLDSKGCHGVPDPVIEVSSPPTRNRDCLLKL